MKVTWRIALELALAIVALIALWSYLSSRDAKVKAEATQAANEKVIAQNDQQIKLLASQVEQLKADQARQLETLRATFSRAQTPQDLAPLVSRLMEFQKPITIVTPPATAENPHPQPALQLAAEDAPQLKAYVQACEECKIKLPSITAQLGKSEQEKQLLANDLVKRTEERDQWHTAAKGGSFWQRFTRSLKYLAIGAGVGAAAVCGSGHCK
ncbi:MAG TPA: hypothetical protein VGR34_06565 [Candidatus Dormibacteraeota bacterium]|nr:hypothetical protein [Candidatus Dormibacteraeota bacterium]